MKEEFDFDKVGKRMPYQVPADFFDTVAEHTLAAAENRAASRQQPKPVRWRVLSIAASVAALLLVGYFLYTGNSGNLQTAQIIAEAAHPNKAASADSLVLPVPAPAVATRQQPLPGPPVKSAKAPAPPPKQQPAQTNEPETLEEILAGISDEELLQLTTMASAEEYVIEQTIN